MPFIMSSTFFFPNILVLATTTSTNTCGSFHFILSPQNDPFQQSNYKCLPKIWVFFSSDTNSAQTLLFYFSQARTSAWFFKFPLESSPVIACIHAISFCIADICWDLLGFSPKSVYLMVFLQISTGFFTLQVFQPISLCFVIFMSIIDLFLNSTVIDPSTNHHWLHSRSSVLTSLLSPQSCATAYPKFIWRKTHRLNLLEIYSNWITSNTNLILLSFSYICQYMKTNSRLVRLFFCSNLLSLSNCSSFNLFYTKLIFLDKIKAHFKKNHGYFWYFSQIIFQLFLQNRWLNRW